MAPVTAANPNLAMRTTGLLDTGATGTGIHPDVVAALKLHQKVSGESIPPTAC